MNNIEILQDPVLKMDILMWQVVKLLIKNKKQILDKFGLTCSRFDILLAIHDFSKLKKEIIQMDLSEKAGIDPMTTSIILRYLERRGLITRTRGTVNTRTIHVELTADGLALFKQVMLQIKSSATIIYEEIDKEGLTSQLLKLSEKLNH